MADLEFAVARRRRKKITFTLEGDEHVYEFNPPKQAKMFMPFLDENGDGISGEMGMVKALFDWLGAGLSEEDNARILARLRDEDDDLDFDSLSEVVMKLTEKITARPTL